MDCLRLAIQRMDIQTIEHMKEWVKKSNRVQDDEFFYRIIEMADNHLFLRLWGILKEYYYSLDFQHRDYKKENYLLILEALASKDEAKTVDAYYELRNLSCFNDKN